MLTNRTRAAVVQLLQSLSPDAVQLLVLKHLDQHRSRFTTDDLLDLLHYASPESIAGLLTELIGGRTAIRTDAPTKYVFDGRLDDLKGNLRADGFEVIEDALTRLVPAAEPVNRIEDSLQQTLQGTTLDSDGEIRRVLRESFASMSASPPDYNDSTTKARIALETVARRAAWLVASARNLTPPADKWGTAITFLRQAQVIVQAEEEALAKVYTLISPGAHVPKGLTDEQWALLARAFALSGAYFLTQHVLAA